MYTKKKEMTEKKKKLRDGRTKTANVDAVDNLICSLDSDGAVGMYMENRIGTLSLNSDLGEKKRSGFKF